VNGLLDVARQTYKETINDIYDTVAEYCGKIIRGGDKERSLHTQKRLILHLCSALETFGLKLKLQFDNDRAFYLDLPADKTITDLPAVFINVLKKKKSISFTTLELVSHMRNIETSSDLYFVAPKEQPC
jgi:DNA mismatch repair protein MSH4